MKDMIPIMRAFFMWTLWLCLYGSNYGLIGENRSKLESRLLKSSGIILREDDLTEGRQTGMPYLDYEEFYPKPYEIRLYFKSSNGNRPKLDELASSRLTQAFDRRSPPKRPLKSIDSSERKLEGWELHVLYIKGVSVLEVYKKTTEITEQELKFLLGLQTANSFWTESSKDELPDGKYSALGFDLVRVDGYLRAKKLNSRALMIFRSQTDEFFHHSKIKEQTELAPESIKGF